MASPVWHVYVLIAPITDGVSFFKIGISSAPLSRVKSVQTGCPMRITQALFLDVPSSKVAHSLEAALHQRFKDKSTSGEWFRFETSQEADKRLFNEGCKEVIDPEIGEGWQWVRLTIEEIREAIAFENGVQAEVRRVVRSFHRKKQQIEMMRYKGAQFAHVASRRKYG